MRTTTFLSIDGWCFKLDDVILVGPVEPDTYTGKWSASIFLRGQQQPIYLEGADEKATEAERRKILEMWVGPAGRWLGSNSRPLTGR